jgi:hypothetical protein
MEEKKKIKAADDIMLVIGDGPAKKNFEIREPIDVTFPS